jgi:hypothetical protein
VDRSLALILTAPSFQICSVAILLVFLKGHWGLQNNEESFACQDPFVTMKDGFHRIFDFAFRLGYVVDSFKEN